MNAADLCLLAAGIFFLTGLLTGLWKYLCILRSADAVAPVYVDIAHRASLMYSFAALLLREFVPYTPVSPAATVWVVAAPLLFFALSIQIYIVHGFLRDTDNQMKKPHRLGKGSLPGWLLQAFMWLLVAAEIGGFLVLLFGFVRSLL